VQTLVKAFRPKQWTKNLLVFAAPFFSFSKEIDIWIFTFIGFLSFCLVSSSVYLINDVIDINNDRKHPTKRFRPIASGSISIQNAVLTSSLLLISSLLLANLINLGFCIALSLYFLIQMAYCIKLKNEPILDIFCISSGFLLRAISGVQASNSEFSPWFLLSIGLLALFLAIEKRKAELLNVIKTEIKTRKSLERYSLSLLKRIEPIVTTSAFMSYSLWAVGPAMNGSQRGMMIVTIPFVLIGIFRYQFITDPEERQRRESLRPNVNPEKPEEILLTDKGILLSIFFWLITIAYLGYSN